MLRVLKLCLCFCQPTFVHASIHGEKCKHGSGVYVLPLRKLYHCFNLSKFPFCPFVVVVVVVVVVLTSVRGFIAWWSARQDYSVYFVHLDSTVGIYVKAGIWNFSSKVSCFHKSLVEFHKHCTMFCTYSSHF